MVNAARAVDWKPSLTLITIFGKAPVWVGVPDRLPLVGSNTAQEGWFWTENVSAVPGGALVVGRNE
jgi:hypothetical protein